MTAMTDLTVITAPPPSYIEEDVEKSEEKPLLHPTSPASTASPTYGAVEYEKVVPPCTGGHDVRLKKRCRAIKIGVCVVSPCIGFAIALSPHGRRRTCRTCGTKIVVPAKKAFC